MPYWLFDLLVLALPAGLLLRSAPALPAGAGRAAAGAVGALAAVALAWTAPWDEHLVRTGVWAYGPDRVLATAGSVPVEEYAFVVLLVVLVAAWGRRTGAFPARPAAPRGTRAGGALGWGAVAAAGALLLLAGGQVRYLGLLLVWVAPPLALQRAVAGDLLRARSRDRLLLVAPVALWLCVADRLALADGVWAISPTSSTGLHLLGLPVEEAGFFWLTTLLVVDGLLLATDRLALGRARALVAGLPWRHASRVDRALARR